MTETIVFIAIVLGGLLFRIFIFRAPSTRFRRKAVLTGGEREFFHLLQRALPECLVCPQMAVPVLLEPVGLGKSRRAALECIDGKRVGYAIFNEDMQLLAVVELDHRERPGRRALARDACFASAGITTLRYHAERLPSETRICSNVFSRKRSAAGKTTVALIEPGSAIEFRKPQTPWGNTLNTQA